MQSMLSYKEGMDMEEIETLIPIIVI